MCVSVCVLEWVFSLIGRGGETVRYGGGEIEGWGGVWARHEPWSSHNRKNSLSSILLISPSFRVFSHRDRVETIRNREKTGNCSGSYETVKRRRDVTIFLSLGNKGSEGRTDGKTDDGDTKEKIQKKKRRKKEEKRRKKGEKKKKNGRENQCRGNADG